MHVRNILSGRRGAAPLAGLAFLLTATLWLTPAARAQRVNPVQALEAALSRRVETAATRKTELDKLIADLRTPGEMGQALLLTNWGDEAIKPPEGDPEEVAKAIKNDRKLREELFGNFLKKVGELVKAGDPATRAAVATLVGEFGASARSGFVSERKLRVVEELPEFVKPLAALAEKDKVPEVRAAAAGALAKLRSDPEKTGAALEAMLKDANPEVRRAAAAALGAAMRGTPASDRGGVAAVVVEPPRENLVAFGPVVARAAGASLADRDVAVRRGCAEALIEVTSALNGQLGIRVRAGIEEQHKALRPVVTALRGQSAALSAAVNDADPEVRYLARRIAEEMGETRLRWLHPEVIPVPLVPEKEKPKLMGAAVTPEELTGLSLVDTADQAEPAKDDLTEVLGGVVTALVRGLKDPEARNRLAAVDALESITAHPEGRTVAEEFGTDPETKKPTKAAKDVAGEAARGLVRALSDPDRFVRWAAARTLGKMAPFPEKELQDVGRGAVTGLARVLSDSDPDVRLRAAAALERFGPAARPAVPALARAASRGDTEARIVAAHAVAVIGGSPEAAVPALAAGLADPNVRMRRAAAEALAAYGPDARAARPALERALRDPDPEVRRLASDALLEVGKGK